jgi:hypothetical protein
MFFDVALLGNPHAEIWKGESPMIQAAKLTYQAGRGWVGVAQSIFKNGGAVVITLRQMSSLMYSKT